MRTAEWVVTRGAKKDWFTQVNNWIKEATKLPDSIGVVMQKYRQFALENPNVAVRNREALRIYPLLLSQYKTGIVDYRLYAQAHDLPFEGTLNHPTYPKQRLAVLSDKCECFYSTLKKDEKGIQGDWVKITGSKEGTEIFVVRFGRIEDGQLVQQSAVSYKMRVGLARCIKVR